MGRPVVPLVRWIGRPSGGPVDRVLGERGEEFVELLLGRHDQCGVEVGEQGVSLAGCQLDVHRDREDAAPQQGDHQLGVRRGTGDEQGDPGLGGQVARIHPSILSGGQPC